MIILRPSHNPEVQNDVHCIAAVKGRVWVGCGSWIFFMSAESLEHEVRAMYIHVAWSAHKSCCRHEHTVLCNVTGLETSQWRAVSSRSDPSPRRCRCRFHKGNISLHLWCRINKLPENLWCEPNDQPTSYRLDAKPIMPLINYYTIL